MAKLITAINSNYVEEVQRVLALPSTKVNAVAKDGFQQTCALHHAIASCKSGNTKIIQALLNAGADLELDPSGSFGVTAVVQCVLLGKLAALREILERKPNVKVNFTGNGGREESLMHLAARSKYNSIEMIDLLVDHGLPVDADLAKFRTQGYSETPLVTAITDRCESSALHLIALGANIHAIDFQGGNLLSYCIYCPKVMKELIKRGLEVNAQDSKGRTALHTSCGNDTAKILLAAGADPNIRNLEGMSPVECALSDAAISSVHKTFSFKRTSAEPLIQLYLTDKTVMYDRDAVLAHATRSFLETAKHNPHIFKKKDVGKLSELLDLVQVEREKNVGPIEKAASAGGKRKAVKIEVVTKKDVAKKAKK